ncbi:FAD-dependent oxidoreductase [Metarhizium robertsii]|uniref:Aromatic-ring hydroxylase-like protein n=2 Tax=Metarhizium robertsii TaxID=568076 RepID=E9F6M5_METRA|nr:Aromatic-ring hydroxylase-like protein [Metarhizium robertsii ARSEF 23]EFY96641.1 Aromatic-ring hydroxylase-like protein [Metarhizium robertsii ARSEF 23]EXU98964.1 FAD-dependent oxidoreductase [Metarhizium robertsii]
MSQSAGEDSPLEVAIVGCGIVGLITAAGLARRRIKVTIFEQGQGLRELGTGIAFNPAAQGCLEMIDPEVTMALRMGGAVGLSAANEDDPHDCLRWIDGYNQRDKSDPYYQKYYLKTNAGYRGIQGIRRDHLLEQLIRVLPSDTVVFKKRLEDVVEGGDDEKIVLKFADGTVAEADAVIGCDGIKSKTRNIVLGPDSTAGKPTYTHVNSYPTVIPMEKAVSALGERKARAFHNHLGPDANILHYPVAHGTMCNVTVFVRNDEEWPQDKPTALVGQRADIEHRFRDWNPAIRDLISHLPETLPTWAVFDLWDYPLPFYNKGRICVAGDAAHASSPHHGAGAGMGVEDALVLSVLMADASMKLGKGKLSKSQVISSAFAVYNDIRRTRSQWLVQSSRRICDLHQQKEWADPTKWLKAESTLEELKDRTYKIWNYDFRQMVAEAAESYGMLISRLEKQASATNGDVKASSLVNGNVLEPIDKTKTLANGIGDSKTLSIETHAELLAGPGQSCTTDVMVS